MPGGRPRKPDELKILDGTFRADKDGDPAVLVPGDGEPVPPGHLKGEALTFWKQIVLQLLKMGVAKVSDSAELAAMCEWHARYLRVSRALDRCPVTGAGSGKLSQLLVSASIAWDKFDRIACRFGLTPSDRAKLRVADRPKGGGVPKRERKAT